MTSTDLARKIIEIIDAYGDDKISIINVIEKYCMQKVQEKEIVCNTIENEITNYCKSHFKSDNNPNEWKESGIAFSAGQLVNFASHFAEWQKQQMMKDAVDGVVYTVYCEPNHPKNHRGISIKKVPDKLKDGQKVKLVIIKEN